MFNGCVFSTTWHSSFEIAINSSTKLYTITWLRYSHYEKKKKPAGNPTSVWICVKDITKCKNSKSNLWAIFHLKCFIAWAAKIKLSNRDAAARLCFTEQMDGYETFSLDPKIFRRRCTPAWGKILYIYDD